MKTIKEIALHLWQLPQHLIAWCLILFCSKDKFMGNYKGRKVFYHPLMPNNRGEGVCFGNYIFMDKREWVEEYVAHEYGHSRQSLYLGWLYLIFIGVPSVCNPYQGARYYSIFCEWWANKLGGIKVVLTSKKICGYELKMVEE